MKNIDSNTLPMRPLLYTIVLLPLLWLLVFIPMHIERNNYYYSLYESKPTDRNLTKGTGFQIMGSLFNEPQREDVLELTPTDIIRLTGSFFWRFFQWGMVQGNVHTGWAYELGEKRTAIDDVVRAMDPTNPTPFLVFLYLATFALMATRGLRRNSDNRLTVTGISAFFNEVSKKPGLTIGTAYFIGGVLSIFSANIVLYFQYGIAAIPSGTFLFVELSRTVMETILFILVARYVSNLLLQITAWGLSITLIATLVRYLFVILKPETNGHLASLSIDFLLISFLKGCLFMTTLTFVLKHWGLQTWSLVLGLSLVAACSEISLQAFSMFRYGAPLQFENLISELIVSIVFSLSLNAGFRLSVRYEPSPNLGH